MGFKPDFLMQNIFADIPVNWLVHSQGFHYAGLKLAEVKHSVKSNKNLISMKEGFNQHYTYKLAVYLLAHAIELMLKSLISVYNKMNASSQLKAPARYSHNVMDMINDLIRVNFISLDEDDYELLKLVDEYLKWFGRYYCPQTKDVPDVLKQAFTEVDENGLIDFKYKLKCPETHTKLDELYKKLAPDISEASLTMQYLTHCP